MTHALSLFRTALGERVDTLAPVLRRHYDLAPGQRVTVSGRMEAWSRYPWLRAFIPIMPKPGAAVPVTVLNCGILDNGEVCYEWERSFDYPSGPAHSYTLTRPAAPGAGGACVLDTFNQPANIAVTLALEVLEGGALLQQRTVGQQFALAGARRLPLPRLFQIRSVAIERALGEDRIYTDVTVSHALLGPLFGYRGELTVADGY
jgi:Domain of unknown function (DUF4166)